VTRLNTVEPQGAKFPARGRYLIRSPSCRFISIFENFISLFLIPIFYFAISKHYFAISITKNPTFLSKNPILLFLFL
jgi:hypothetical protein